MESFSEKSEKPTAKRLRRAQKEGDFPYSTRFASALFITTAFLLISLYTLWLIPLFKEIFIDSFSSLHKTTEPLHHLLPLYTPIIKMVASLLVFLAILLFITHSWQGHFTFSFAKPKGKQESQRGYLLLYLFITYTLIIFLGYLFITTFHPSSTLLIESSEKQISFIIRELFLITMRSLPLFLLLTFFDYLMQRKKFYKRMHMTKEEIKEEAKEEAVKRK